MAISHDLSIIIPAFNEETAIQTVLRGLTERLPHAEIILVDDGSTDDTASEAARVPGVIVIRHAHNAGYGASIKTGVRRSTRDIVAWFDADGEHRIEDLIAMVEKIRIERLGAVLGRRSLRKGPLIRIVGKAAIVLLARSLHLREGTDLNCGLRAFRREVISPYLTLLPDGYSASLTSTMIVAERCPRFAFHPVSVRPRIGQSKVRLQDGLRTMMVVIRLTMLFAPLRIFFRSGVLLSIAGLAYGFGVAMRQGLGFPAAAVLAVTIGFMLCMLGLIADQISHLRMDQFRTATPTLPSTDRVEHLKT